MKLDPFRLERFFAAHELDAPYVLCSSDCESFTVAELLGMEDGSWDGMAGLRLGYTEARGDSELRERIAGLYDGFSAEQILVHAGAEEAIFTFMNVALDPGDHAIVHAPCYQSLEEIARGIGAEVTEWKGDPGKRWALDLELLRDRLTDRTRVVVVNFPHNPTGFLPDRSFLDELSRLSDERGFVVFSDEVYRGLEYNPAERLPSFSEINEQAVSISVMSKAYGLAGLRIGWVATRNRTLYDKLAAFKDYTSICNSAPSEYLSSLALRHHQRIVDRNLGIIRDNLDHLAAFFARHQGILEWYRPRAGSIAFPRYLGGSGGSGGSRSSVEGFCDELRRRAGVLLLPGTMYGPEYGCVRVGFGRRNLPEALQRFERFLHE